MIDATKSEIYIIHTLVLYKNRKKDLKKTNRTEKLQCLQTAVEIEKPLVLIEIQFQKSHFVLYDFRTQTSDLSNKGKEAFNHQHIVVFVDLQEPNP